MKFKIGDILEYHPGPAMVKVGFFTFMGDEDKPLKGSKLKVIKVYNGTLEAIFLTEAKYYDRFVTKGTRGTFVFECVKHIKGHRLSFISNIPKNEPEEA